jgi:DNA-binding IclR family transcriptional regulator
VVELFDLVQSDRERGHVAGAGFYESSISTIAAPVRDHSGRVIAALGVTLASAQIDPSARRSWCRVCAAADELSELLNYRPQSSAQVLSITSRRAGGGHA